MKKAKIFTLFSMLLFCISAVAFGVYAASAASQKMNVGGQIVIPPNLVDVTVLGYIGDADADSNNQIDESTSATLKYNSANHGSSWQFAEGDLVFDVDKKEEVNKVAKITLTLKITNNSEVPLNVTFTPTGTGDNLPNDVIDLTLFNQGQQFDGAAGISLAGTLGSVQIIKVQFSLKQFLDIETDFAFNYLLNMADSRV